MKFKTFSKNSGFQKLNFLKILFLLATIFLDDDREIDNGLTLALALVQRAEVFFRLHDGVHALNDLQLAVKCGLPVKDNAEYYAKLAKNYACECWDILLAAFF